MAMYGTLVTLVGRQGLSVQLVNALMPVIGGSLVFFAVCKLLHVEEMALVVRSARRMIGRRTAPVG